MVLKPFLHYVYNRRSIWKTWKALSVSNYRISVLITILYSLTITLNLRNIYDEMM